MQGISRVVNYLFYGSNTKLLEESDELNTINNDNTLNDEIELESKSNENENEINDNNDEEEEEDDNESEDSFDMEECIKTFDTIEEELKFLREQNSLLKNKIKKRKKMKRPRISPEELSKRVQEKLPEFLKKADYEAHPNVIFVPSEIDGEVGMIDKSSIDWWSVVDLENNNPNNNNNNNNCLSKNDELVFTDAIKNVSLGGPFILLKEQDVIDAIAHFVAHCVVTMPECQGLDNEQLMTMLDNTFGELREKGFFGKVWDWGLFTYNIYGYGTYCWYIYDNPVVARMVTSAFWSAAIWLIAL